MGVVRIAFALLSRCFRFAFVLLSLCFRFAFALLSLCFRFAVRLLSVCLDIWQTATTHAFRSFANPGSIAGLTFTPFCAPFTLLVRQCRPPGLHCRPLCPYLAPFSLTENTYTALAAWEEDIINGPVPGIGFPSLSFVNNRCCSSFSAGKMTGDDSRVEKLRMQLLSQFVIFYFAFE